MCLYLQTPEDKLDCHISGAVLGHRAHPFDQAGCPVGPSDLPVCLRTLGVGITSAQHLAWLFHMRSEDLTLVWRAFY